MSVEGGEAPEVGVRSCKTCPSFISADEPGRSFFGRATGMDHCARYGFILGKPEMHPRQAEGLRRHHAKPCTMFGMPRPLGPTWVDITPPAAMPSRAALMAQQSHDEPDRVSDCRDCMFYNRRGAEDAGMRGGAICSARAEFIFDRQTASKGVNCGQSVKLDWNNPNRAPISEPIQLVPALVDAFYKQMTPLERWREQQKNFVDPSEYPTDRPVEVDEAKRGIRAWREIVDDDTGNSVFMPVYDMAALATQYEAGTPERRQYDRLAQLVPQSGDDEHPENFIDYDGLVYMLIALWYELDETPALWGYPGTGKTEILRHMAWLMQLPFHRISITASTELEELVGQYALRNGETEFMHGRLPRAWKSPGVICLDEPNVGPPEVWQAIRPLTDNSKQFVIDKNGGEVIPRHPDSFLGIAMNPAWEVRNIGADVISDADSSRLAHLYVNYPPSEIEREIMREWADDDTLGWKIEDSVLVKILQISSELRDMSTAGTLSVSWGVRHNIKVAKASRLFSLRKAYEIAIMNYLDPTERETVRGAVAANLK